MPLRISILMKFRKLKKRFLNFKKTLFAKKFDFWCFIFLPERTSGREVFGRKKSQIGAKLDFLELFENPVLRQNPFFKPP